MTTARKWSNVAVAMQSALATAVTITGITKASPGVVTYTGTDPSNGDYVFLSVSGMHQLTGTADITLGHGTDMVGIDFHADRLLLLQIEQQAGPH